MVTSPVLLPIVIRKKSLNEVWRRGGGTSGSGGECELRGQRRGHIAHPAVGALLAELAHEAGERAAGAGAEHQHVHAALARLDDLLRRAVIVRQRVARVRVLQPEKTTEHCSRTCKRKRKLTRVLCIAPRGHVHFG